MQPATLMSRVSGLEASGVLLSVAPSRRAGPPPPQAAASKRRATAERPTPTASRVRSVRSRRGANTRGARGGDQPGGNPAPVHERQPDPVRRRDHVLDDDGRGGMAPQLIEMEGGGVAHAQR